MKKKSATNNKKKITTTTKTTTTTVTTTATTKRVTRSSAAAAAAAAAAAVTAAATTTITSDTSLSDNNLTEDEFEKEHDVRVTQDHTKKKTTFWATRQGRGLLTFIVSGVFHELLIMSTCRRITLENFMFFTVQGLAVTIETEIRQGALKQEPTGMTRIICILLQLLFMSITGRLFTGPFLRYNFFRVD